MAYFEEAKHDLAKEDARSIRHSLETAEKAVKGLLILRGHGTFLRQSENEDKSLRESFELVSRKKAEERLEAAKRIFEDLKKVSGI